MIIKKSFLDKKIFLNDLSSLFKNSDKSYLESYSEKISQLLDSYTSASDFLMFAGTIENEEVEIACRRAAFAQIFDVRINQFDRSRATTSYIKFCSSQIAVIQVPYKYTNYLGDCSVVISKFGNIIIDEGVLWLGGFYNGLCQARKIVDEDLTDVIAIFSSKGEIVIPFGLFDRSEVRSSHCTVWYKTLEYDVIFAKKISEFSSEELQHLLPFLPEGNDFDRVVLISQDNIISVLDQGLNWIEPTQESLNEFYDVIAPYRLTEEIIQKELDTRK